MSFVATFLQVGEGGCKRMMKRSHFALASAVIVTSASSHADIRAPVRSMLEQRHERVVIQDWDLSCGAAALATILRFQHDDPVSERDVALAMISRQEYIANPKLVRYRHGFSLLDLKRYVDGRGYRGVGLGQMELEDLVGRAPIMVPLDLFGYKHFVVFRGISGNRVLLADPAWGTRTMTIDRFRKTWLVYPKLGRVGFVVEGREGRVPANELKPRSDEFPMLR